MAQSGTNDLRRFLSYDWQDAAAVSIAIFKEMGIRIKPDRLVKIYTRSYPDVVADACLLRRVPAEGNPKGER